jgi:tetratricopeptide (TPR) repeat protein
MTTMQDENSTGGRFPRVLGIYSSEDEVEAGSGSTKKRVIKKIYWYVRQVEDEKFELQPLNANHVPSGIIKEVDLKGFSGLTPEPSYYKKITLPVLESLQEKVDRGEKYFNKGQLSAAERQFLEALKIDDLNVRANFGLGEVYAEKQEFVKIRHVLGVLLALDETFREEHRKRFNSLGVSLRKNGLAEEAIKYYGKALEYNEKDDHLHFNMARAYYDKGEFGKCEQHVERALELNPEFREARLFKRYLQSEGPSKLTHEDRSS